MSSYMDSHVHSCNSWDSHEPMIEYMKRARKLGLREITFTEHYDDYTGIKTDAKEVDIEKYREDFLNSKKSGLGRINFGIELGLRPKSEEKIKKVVRENNFDFIIGSSHITDGKDIAYDSSFFEDGAEAAILKYLGEVYENIVSYNEDFDVYGHLDYIIRYVNKFCADKVTKLDYDYYKNALDRILLTLKKYNKGIEVNASGYKYGFNTTHPGFDIIKRYKELGGKIITLGSDAHSIEQLGWHFDEAVDLIEKAGFDEIAVYHNREPEFIKIKCMK